MANVRTSWFTFGSGQAHHVGGRTYDPSTIVKITAPDPRARMVELFGQTWSMEYLREKDLDLENWPPNTIVVEL